MGHEQRVNIARYQAAQQLLDRGVALTVVLQKRGMSSHGELLRRELGGLVLALADGRLEEARALATCVERTLDVVVRRLGVRRQVLEAFEALDTLERALAPARPEVGPALAREPMPAIGDWTTAVWERPMASGETAPP